MLAKMKFYTIFRYVVLKLVKYAVSEIVFGCVRNVENMQPIKSINQKGVF